MGRAALASAYECPGSPAFVHASCKVSVEAHAPCDDVRNEVLSRVKGQYLKWHDPHNNGTYTLTDTGADGSLSLQRVTGNKKYTDKMRFVFADAKDGSCSVKACSESQVMSVADFSTNYCNLRMLYCSKGDGCHPVNSNFEVAELEVSPSFGAGTNKADCLKV